MFNQEYTETAAELIQLHQQLQICLKQERTALIELKTEILFQNNQLKENLLFQLIDTSRKIKQLGDRLIQEGEGDAFLVELRAKVEEAWAETQKLCAQNRRLIEHSLKNLNAFADNLRRLFGEKVGYSSRGENVQGISEGCVVQTQL